MHNNLLKKHPIIYNMYVISNIYKKIGYADELGSGMRNTNKYTKLYLGRTGETNKKTADMIIDILESRPEIVVNELAEF